MKPVDQIIFGSPNGNCLTACLASILEIPLETIPFNGDTGWFDKLNAWLYPRGFYALCFEFHDLWRPSGLYILCGRSPRGDFSHCVVAKGDSIIHGPHPSRAGVLSWDDGTIIVPLDPLSLP